MKKIKSEKPKEKPRMFCPKCQNNCFSIISGGRYECISCAFVGKLPDFYKAEKK